MNPIWDDLRARLDAEHEQREAALAGTRQIIQASSKAIRACHRQETDKAHQLADEARQSALQLREAMQGTPRMLYAGYLQDAEKEMVEAVLLLAMIEGQEYPSAQDLGVEAHTYAHGIAEAASELRRTILDQLRADNYAEAQRLMSSMELVYDELITLDYPDGLTGGLRRATDALRAVLERTRADLTMTIVQERLRTALRVDEIP